MSPEFRFSVVSAVQLESALASIVVTLLGSVSVLSAVFAIPPTFAKTPMPFCVLSVVTEYPPSVEGMLTVASVRLAYLVTTALPFLTV